MMPMANGKGTNWSSRKIRKYVFWVFVRLRRTNTQKTNFIYMAREPLTIAGRLSRSLEICKDAVMRLDQSHAKMIIMEADESL
jgi:hypothetical protein